MSELKISDGGREAKDPAAKLPDTVGFAPRGGSEAGGAGRDKAGGMTEEVGREREG